MCTIDAQITKLLHTSDDEAKWGWEVAHNLMLWLILKEVNIVRRLIKHTTSHIIHIGPYIIDISNIRIVVRKETTLTTYDDIAMYVYCDIRVRRPTPSTTSATDTAH